MGVQTHRDLRAWQLAHAVRTATLELTARPEVKRDFPFCDQAQRAANGVCRNIAEGFGRYQHADFGRFIVIARSSLFELLAIRTVSALRAYLQSTPTPKRRGRT